ncbi:MAG: chemotaxis response regulator protein-glutamate methylesterase [Candidatus Cloacimonetes bacterium 4572_55]|nr:MAG: chemotaxis response regulator protein-glutamate methylesterase [Candidatus Cloacimonetes bacterium 4572_55]
MTHNIGSNKPPIKVLLVDDSPLALIVLKRMLSESKDIEVLGMARNGLEALELIPKLQPDVICTDLHMPKMNGLELIKVVMEKFPKPILVISVSVREDEDSQNIFKLIQAGAVDVFPKPQRGLHAGYQDVALELINKIKILSGVVVFHKFRRKRILTDRSKFQKFPISPSPSLARPARIVAIGASTGGPQALQTILSQLPKDFPVPVVCIQHISNGFLDGLVGWLDSCSRLKIKIAEAGELPRKGMIYFQKEKYQLEFSRKGEFVVKNRSPINGHCPSITTTFNSLASCYRKFAVAVLLTGMGDDGAVGMKSIQDAGGVTIAQSEVGCVVFGMPQKAIELGAARYVLRLENIPNMLRRLTKDTHRPD